MVDLSSENHPGRRSPPLSPEVASNKRRFIDLHSSLERVPQDASGFRRARRF